jgi:predicted ATPase
MKVIVLTGGTLGGKTTIIQNLKRLFSDEIITIPEVSSLLFENEFKRPKVWTLKWHYLLQRAILDKQMKLEEDAKIKARNKGVKVIICDRGILDPSAYLKGGLNELVQEFGVNEKKALMRYDQIIHLVSLSVLRPDLYDKFVSTNPHRIETIYQARKQEKGSLNAWKNHPNRIVLSREMKDNMKRVLEIVESSVKM